MVAHRNLSGSGATITVATPGGAAPTVDPISLDPAVVGDAQKAKELAAYLAAIAPQLSSPATVGDIDIAQFDAVVVPGGHGPMVDLATDPAVGALLSAADGEGKIIAPFCHGPAALLSAVKPDGSLTFAGRNVTVFSNDEELGGGLGENSPYFVQTALEARGVNVASAQPWTSHVVRDGNLITGQNPQSSEAVAAAVIESLRIA